jgi:hypothetical protein
MRGSGLVLRHTDFGGHRFTEVATSTGSGPPAAVRRAAGIGPGAYANVTGTLRVPGKPAARAEIGLVRWRARAGGRACRQHAVPVLAAKPVIDCHIVVAGQGVAQGSQVLAEPGFKPSGTSCGRTRTCGSSTPP